MSEKSKLCSFLLLAILLVSLSFATVAAQYQFQKTTNFTIGSDGTATLTISEVGITYDIQGTPGATGSVTTIVWVGNEHPTATIPANMTLTYFLGVTIDMNANNFEQGVVTVTYTDANVAGLKDIRVFNYVSNTNSYVEVPSSVYTNTKTITVAFDSLSNPYLAVGGLGTGATVNPEIPWITILVVIIIVVIVVVVVFMFLRRRSSVDYVA